MSAALWLLEVVLAGAVVAWLARETFRDEHLLVLRFRRAGTWLLEHQGGGRYHSIRQGQLPGAVARYARTRLAAEGERIARRLRELLAHPFGARA